MKKILITGAGSYIGTQVQRHLESFPGRYQVTSLNMHGDHWRSCSFSGYDAVLHVAGIAHSDTGHADERIKARYYKVNTQLAIETAKKAKADGAGQFLFLSSAIVYGDSAPIGKTKRITPDTPASPANFYGDSKLQAEKGIAPLNCDRFRVVILRPPMVYGKGSRGNYPLLSRLAKTLPVFPKIENRRSVLYVGHLAEFIRLMIDNREQGIFWPQDPQSCSTGELAVHIAAAHGKKLRLLAGVSWALKGLSFFVPGVNKAFGSLVYDEEMSKYRENYQHYTLSETIALTELP